MYMYMHVYAYAHVHVHVCVYVYLHVYVHVYGMCVCMCVQVYSHVCLYVYTTAFRCAQVSGCAWITDGLLIKVFQQCKQLDIAQCKIDNTSAGDASLQAL